MKIKSNFNIRPLLLPSFPKLTQLFSFIFASVRLVEFLKSLFRSLYMMITMS